METDFCNFCKKPIINVADKMETEGGITCTVKMRGNSVKHDYPYTKFFDVDVEVVLCDDCACTMFNAVRNVPNQCKRFKDNAKNTDYHATNANI